MSLPNQIITALYNASGAALLQGAVVRLTTGVRQAVLATLSDLASTIAIANNASGVGGVFLAVIGGGEAKVLLDTGLTPVAGQILYVSATPGRGTTVVSSKVIGTIIDASKYTTANPRVTVILNDAAGAEDRAAWIGNAYFAVDNENGSDANDGFSLVSMADAGTRPIKTLGYLKQIVPPIGTLEARVIIALKPRSDGGVYKKADGVTDDDLILQFIGYQQPIVRGSLDFSNNAADKTRVGGITSLAGPNGDGSFTVLAGATVSSFTIAAGALTAEPALLGQRVRFTGNVTPALANAVQMIAVNTGTVITTGQDLGTAPAVGDTFFIEGSGVRVASVLINAIGDQRNSSSVGGVLVGVKTSGGFMIDAPGSSFAEAFCEGAGTTRFRGGQFIYVKSSYVDETFTEIQVGGGHKQTANGFTVSADQIKVFNSAIHGNIANLSDYTVLDGTGASYFAATFFLLLAPTVGGTKGADGLSVFGNFGTGRRTRCKVSNTILQGTLAFRGVEYAGITTAASSGGDGCIVPAGEDITVTLDDVINGGGNTVAFGLDMIRCYECTVIAGTRVVNTVTGATGDVRLAAAVPFSRTWAELAATAFVDKNGNDYIGAGNGQSVSRLTNGTWNNVPILGADPAAPLDGDTWITNIGGVRNFCARIAGTTYRALLA